eukprot:c6419_g1_i2.p1 GENE.c6419_g1_i2~~c6419_g1_i2.p1  ORF type:complete len:150 (-),score=30.01 c6419_g1_i2:74-523(-)
MCYDIAAYHHYTDPTQRPPILEEIAGPLLESDAIVVISAEYNHSFPPALKNMLDHFGGSFFMYKPSGIVTYSPGPWGGRHAAISLLPVLHELGCLPVSNMFGISNARNSIAEDGSASDEWVKRFWSMGKQLEWMAEAMKRQRELVGVPR